MNTSLTAGQCDRRWRYVGRLLMLAVLAGATGCSTNQPVAAHPGGPSHALAATLAAPSSMSDMPAFNARLDPETVATFNYDRLARRGGAVRICR